MCMVPLTASKAALSPSAYEAFVCKEDMTTSLVVKVEEVHCKIGNKLFVFALDGLPSSGLAASRTCLTEVNHAFLYFTLVETALEQSAKAGRESANSFRLLDLRSCIIYGTPLRPSAPLWPHVTSDCLHLASFVVNWMELPPFRTTFRLGRHSNEITKFFPTFMEFEQKLLQDMKLKK
ncbi:hypothetical protein P5673_032168 [Acropora cervicornis]|uniref:Uncharacterized protein n=1 Tax=Acropora cervicornis TaxID=6130 RepID=A0AAD9PRJ3_ACRCE|nr:hypothetical protein P5673_032168 [Acropora cervicornis]